MEFLGEMGLLRADIASRAAAQGRDQPANRVCRLAQAAIAMDFQASDVRIAQIYVRLFELILRASGALHAAACLRAGHKLVTLDKRLEFAAKALGLDVLLLA
jgi:predicted nucleic acid-binding protein